MLTGFKDYIMATESIGGIQKAAGIWPQFAWTYYLLPQRKSLLVTAELIQKISEIRE